MPTQLQIDCPAKVNLTLSIGSPLESGMHPLSSWMVAVHFADELSLSKSIDAQSHFELHFHPDAPVKGVVDWPIPKDLAFRAHQLIEQHVGRPVPINLSIAKHIPAGAGLGGGSSDAAGTLVGINKLYELGLDTPTLQSLGRKLGSDVAFLIAAATGQPSALVEGLGEILIPAPLAELIHLVLIFPGFGCPTGDVYKAFDRQRVTEATRHFPPDAKRVRRIAKLAPVPQDSPFNDLADPAFEVRPKLRELWEKVQNELGIPVHVTGSGSTLFIIAPSAITAKALSRKVTATTGLASIATRTLATKGT